MPRRHLIPLVLACHLTALAADWPQWRGPTRDGHSTESSGWANGAWALADKPAWTAEVGAGGSSPIVAQGRVYTLGWKDGQDQVTALDAVTGKTVWTQAYPAPKYGRKATGDEGLYDGPSATPTFDAARSALYTLGIDGDLRAWKAADGAPLWQINLYALYDPPQRPKIGRSGRRDYGMPGAPLLVNNQLLVEVGSEQGTVMAFDPATGKRLWASQVRRPAGHTGGMAPLTVQGVPCLAVLTTYDLVVMRLDPGHEGRTVATVEWTTDFANNIVSPVVVDDTVLITSKYNHGAMRRIRFTLTGAETLWETRAASGVCTPVVHQGAVYWISDQAMCVDLATGAPRWTGAAFGDAGSCLVTADGKLLAWGGRGRLALIEATPTAYQELAVREIGAREDVWPHVALADGRVLCRDRHGRLKCFALPH